MIKITHLYKRFNKKEVLSDINLNLPRNGIVVIYGPSGCGKTTLLNCLSGLLDFTGEIFIDSKFISKLNDKQLSDFRLRNMGFIFQDFKLFDNQSILQNIIFPLETVSNSSKERKKRKVKDLLELVNLKNVDLKMPVKKMSGGEKQRVAIARALVNDPKIILADEPTGALDNKNATEVMDILEKISLKSLVVVVSHDKELTEKYADIIIEMKDGKIVNNVAMIKHKGETYIPIIRNENSNKISSIPSNFLFHHTLSCIKEKKWRTLICNTITSLGLIGVGIAISLSSAISSNIKSAYSSLIDDSKITISLKEEGRSENIYSGSYLEANEIKKKYKQYINDIGICYYNNFESIFPDRNCICLTSTSYYSPIEGLSARHINEFRWLDLANNINIYPNSIKTLQNDEVILGLTIDMVRKICFDLKITRTVTSLSEYIKNNDVNFYFDFANYSWEYDDQQILTIRGFTLEQNPCIYHSNHLWNEYMFEEMMSFPTMDSITKPLTTPATLRKIYYFETQNNRDEFLALAREEDYFDDYSFEIANAEYYPWLYMSSSTKDMTRLLFYVNENNYIKPRFVKYFQDEDANLISPIYGSQSGYAIYADNLMMGFASMTYFSSTQEGIDDTIDTMTSLSLQNNETSTLPNGVLSGHFTKTSKNGVIFKTLEQKINYGNKPETLDEIVISSSMAKYLFKTTNVVGKQLYVAFTSLEQYYQDGRIKREYVEDIITISGVINSDKYALYHDTSWSLAYFQSRLGVSIFNLGVTSISLDVKNANKVDSSLNRLKKAFPQYKITNPLKSVNSSIDEICGYLEIALAAFSFIAVIISSLLLTVSNYLHILENKRDIALARCIGINKKESKKFLFSHSIIMCLVSFIMSSVELFMVSFVIAYEIGDVLGSGFNFTFNPLALVAMLVLSLSISLLSSFII